MEKFIEKAEVLIEALPYIKKFHGKKVVIKFGGSVMEEKEKIFHVLQDIVFMSYVGMKPLIIHGGGPAISAAMKKNGLTPHFVNGLRVTDRATMDIVEDVLVNTINKEIVDMLNSMDGWAQGISGRDGGFISVEKMKPTRNITQALKDIFKHKPEEELDLGYVGDITSINPIPVQEIKNNNKIPVIAPIGVGKDGCSYNINGDIVAGEIAAALGAERLVFLTDVIGIMKNPKDESSLMSSLHSNEVEELIEKKVIQGGMIPKVNSCVKALKFGAQKAHIIDGRIDHSLLLEMFTNKGIGTEIIH